MRLSVRVSFRAGAAWAMGLLLAAYLGGLALHGSTLNPVVDDWLGILTMWVPAAVCWLAVARMGFARREALLAAAALTSFAAGNTYYVGSLSGGMSLPFPSPADVGYLLFYPLMLAAAAVAVRRQARGSASSVWWDCAVGSLGAAAGLAVLLNPVLESALAGAPSLVTVVAIAYPAFDLLLVAAVAGAVALRDVRLRTWWGLLVVGLLVFTATDVVYALQVTAESYVVGTPLDAGWPIGLALVALWVDGAERRDGPANHRPGEPARTMARAPLLVVPVGATAAALGVLLMAARTRLSMLAVVLAGVTLLAAAARTQVAFGQLATMADLRRHEATTDPLTGLPNRRALATAADDRLADPRRPHALLLLDLDKFKDVNDSLGHHVGDLLLVRVGVRLRAQLAPGDLLARLGGDEFAILVPDAGPDEAGVVAARLRAALAKTFTLDDIALHCAVSIGIALFPDDGAGLSTLLRKADIAMYKAKSTGDGHHVYGTGDDIDVAARLRTTGELHSALTTGQLVLHYQPKIDLPTGQVRGVEALVRWNHPTRGLLYLDAFLTLVEEAGLMPAMTRVVLATALDQAASWHTSGRHLTIAVNLSASCLVDANLPDQVVAMLADRGIPPTALQLEITEKFLMADRDRARTILTQLREAGVQISIDDFGTGYSSLSYLRDLPVDELKLDRSFIVPMTGDARAAALVASTIDLAHSLDLRMVAEGVDTQDAYTALKDLGCDQAQGYHMCRPIPAADLDHWLRTRSAGETHAGLPHPRTSPHIRKTVA